MRSWRRPSTREGIFALAIAPLLHTPYILLIAVLQDGMLPPPYSSLPVVQSALPAESGQQLPSHQNTVHLRVTAIFKVLESVVPSRGKNKVVERQVLYEEILMLTHVSEDPDPRRLKLCYSDLLDYLKAIKRVTGVYRKAIMVFPSEAWSITSPRWCTLRALVDELSTLIDICGREILPVLPAESLLRNRFLQIHERISGYTTDLEGMISDHGLDNRA